LDCIFCKIVAKEIPAKIVHEDDNTLAFHDIDPKAPTHVLVIPKKHIPTLIEAVDEEGIINNLFKVAKEIAQKEGIDQSGFRTVINCKEDAGQAVFHVHLHLLGGRRLGWPPG
jgi:histidine triad (HIT) family protein